MLCTCGYFEWPDGIMVGFMPNVAACDQGALLTFSKSWNLEGNFYFLDRQKYGFWWLFSLKGL